MSGNNSPINAQLFLDSADATSDALATFVELPGCSYMNKTLGSSQQAEVMACDCTPASVACDEDSGCINRLTSIECVRCCKGCHNKRFQSKSYAAVDVISTPKKGFGLRATADIAAGAFVYEYVGEVIDEPAFQKRTQLYVEQGVKHFYFMMLQKGEFIDATKKGGLGRFCNHSCAPNGHVEKWVVGRKLRMGIFASRDIRRGEEVTFDYNVDRYGAEAQPCYCGEKNCVGFLGGKTQTESAGKVSGVLTAALGLSARDINAVIRGKKSSEDVQPRPLVVGDVSKVMASLMLNQESWQVNLIVQRVALCSDPPVQAAVMRMHGYQIFAQILASMWGDNALDWSDDDRVNVTLMLLRVLQKLPRITKNKISSSKIETVIKNLSDSENSDISEIARELLSEWANLKMAYRIPRRKVEDSEVEVTDEKPDSRASSSEDLEDAKAEKGEKPLKKTASQPQKTVDGATAGAIAGATAAGVIATSVATLSPNRSTSPFAFIPTPYSNKSIPKGPKKGKTPLLPAKPPPSTLPAGWDSATDPNGRIYYYNRDLSIEQWDFPKVPQGPRGPKGGSARGRAVVSEPVSAQVQRENDLKRIIEQARLAKEEQQKNDIPKTSKGSKTSKSSSGGSASSNSMTASQKLTKMMAKVVPNQVSKYNVGRDRVKKCSKEIVQILVDKELKRPQPMTEISDEKAKKIREFVKGYMSKVVKRQQEKGGKEASSGGKKRKGSNDENDSYENGPTYEDEVVKKVKVDMEIELE